MYQPIPRSSDWFHSQGHKSLHGHFLLFLKNWKMFLDILQRRPKEQNMDENQLSFRQAKDQSKKLFANACSANLFSDFAAGGILDGVPVFPIKTAGVNAEET